VSESHRGLDRHAAKGGTVEGVADIERTMREVSPPVKATKWSAHASGGKPDAVLSNTFHGTLEGGTRSIGLGRTTAWSKSLLK
jgi:hypothetical protein